MRTSISVRRRVNIGLAIALCLCLPLLIDCKKKDQAQDGAPPAAVDTPAGSSKTAGSDLFDKNGKIKLRILCTTSPKEGRTDDFVAFLKEHFVAVGTTDYLGFNGAQAEGYDVVILDDGTTRPGSQIPSLPPTYARATVTVGVSGSMICQRNGYKPGYL